MARKGLGKGLDAIIGSAANTEGQRLLEVPVADIKPNPGQPRTRFDRESIEGMARSIKAFGVLQPVILRPVGTEYELIAGERRWLAAKEAGLERIPAIVRESSETGSLEIALIENIHRDGLNGIEQAHAYQRLLDDFGITHEELSGRLGKSRVSISNTMRLLKLPLEVQDYIMNGEITEGHARAILQVEGDEARKNLARRVVKEGLSVRETEIYAGKLENAALDAGAEKRKKGTVPVEVSSILRRLEEILDTRVRASFGKKKGRVIVEVKDIGDLKRIADIVESGVADTERFR
ncbi:MAG: ParB/RepB/Spo0J family partition protein [Actinomycetota bacterium]|nr:ParB/RepB/Spo0J family partition protein [Actinomycetota bacterium]